MKFRNEKNRERTDDEKALRVKGLLEKEKEKRTRLKELGIDYEFSGYLGIVDGVQKALHEQAKEEIKTERKATVPAAAAPVVVAAEKASASKKAKK